MEPALIKLNRGGALNGYLNLRMDPDTPYKFSKDYAYIEIPFGDAMSLSSEEEVDEAVRNQRIRVRPGCRIDLQGPHRALVKTNPILQTYGICPQVILLEPGDGEELAFNVTFQRDFDFRKLDWCVRIYLLS